MIDEDYDSPDEWSDTKELVEWYINLHFEMFEQVIL
jgi:hypothetical protein